MKLLTTVLLIILFTIGCEKTKKKVYVRPNTRVKVESIKLEESYDKLILVGQLEGIKEINIFPDGKVTGIVKNIRISEGNKVKYGSPLMEIDQGSFTGYQFKNFIVKSKISGTVTNVYVKDGALATPKTILCKIVKMKKLKLVVDVSEADISKVEVGQLVHFYVKTYPNERFTGRFSNIFPALDPNTLTLRAEVIVNNKSYRLKPGMFARAEAVISKAMKILIPLNSMMIEDNIRYVYVYDKKTKKVNYRTIVTGNYYDKKIEVISGLKAGDLIVVDGNYQVTDNEKVRVEGLEN